MIRWEGEEFLIVGRFTRKAELLRQAERIRLTIARQAFEISTEVHFHITCSIGIASFPFIQNDLGALSWEQTLSLADMALYTAKNNSKNMWISLYEKNIPDSCDFQHLIQQGLASLIRQDLIDFDTSADKTGIRFL